MYQIYQQTQKRHNMANMSVPSQIALVIEGIAESLEQSHQSFEIQAYAKSLELYSNSVDWLIGLSQIFTLLFAPPPPAAPGVIHYEGIIKLWRQWICKVLIMMQQYSIYRDPKSKEQITCALNEAKDCWLDLDQDSFEAFRARQK